MSPYLQGERLLIEVGTSSCPFQDLVGPFFGPSVGHISHTKPFDMVNKVQHVEELDKGKVFVVPKYLDNLLPHAAGGIEGCKSLCTAVGSILEQRR